MCVCSKRGDIGMHTAFYSVDLKGRETGHKLDKGVNGKMSRIFKWNLINMMLVCGLD
jgi:hypothetical protein